MDCTGSVHDPPCGAPVLGSCLRWAPQCELVFFFPFFWLTFLTQAYVVVAAAAAVFHYFSFRERMSEDFSLLSIVIKTTFRRESTRKATPSNLITPRKEQLCWEMCKNLEMLYDWLAQ